MIFQIHRYINILKSISYAFRIVCFFRTVSSSLNQLIIILDNIINNYSIYLFLFLQYDIDKNLQELYKCMKNITKSKICAKYFPLHYNI